MTLEFRKGIPEYGQEESIYLDSRRIGWVRVRQQEDGEKRCHAGIELFGPIWTTHSLIQGHGATRELAVKNAMRDATKSFTAALIAVEALQNKIGSLK